MKPQGKAHGEARRRGNALVYDSDRCGGAADNRQPIAAELIRIN